MLSPGFEDTFEKAAIAIVARHGRDSVQAILADIRRRASESNETDPRKNRRLFLDASKSSQMIGVKCRDYETVIDELKRLGLVHVWKRVICPVHTNDIIVETNKAQKLRKSVSKTCPHCGNVHSDLADEYIETVHAINFTLAEKPMGMLEYLLSPSSPPINKPKRRWRITGIFDFFRPRDDSPAEQAAKELEKNRPAKLAPAPSNTFLVVIGSALVWMIITSCIALPTAIFINGWTGIAVSVVSCAIFAVVILLAWNKIFNAYPLAKNVLFYGSIAAGVLFATGFVEFSVGWQETKLNEWPKFVLKEGGINTESPDKFRIGCGVVVLIGSWLFSWLVCRQEQKALVADSI